MILGWYYWSINSCYCCLSSGFLVVFFFLLPLKLVLRLITKVVYDHVGVVCVCNLVFHLILCSLWSITRSSLSAVLILSSRSCSFLSNSCILRSRVIVLSSKISWILMINRALTPRLPPLVALRLARLAIPSIPTPLLSDSRNQGPFSVDRLSQPTSCNNWPDCVGLARIRICWLELKK